MEIHSFFPFFLSPRFPPRFLLNLCITYLGRTYDDDLSACTHIEDGRIGIIDIIVDENTYTVIDRDAYQYEVVNDEEPLQIIYRTPDLIARDITCYVNIQWANLGDTVSASSPEHSNHSDEVWKVLIVVSVVVVLGLLGERIHFHQKRRDRIAYSKVDEEADLSLSMCPRDVSSRFF